MRQAEKSALSVQIINKAISLGASLAGIAALTFGHNGFVFSLESSDSGNSRLYVLGLSTVFPID